MSTVEAEGLWMNGKETINSPHRNLTVDSSDKMIEVFGFQAWKQLAKATINITPPEKVQQGKEFVLEVKQPAEHLTPIQLDGEVYEFRGDFNLKISHCKQINFLSL